MSVRKIFSGRNCGDTDVQALAFPSFSDVDWAGKKAGEMRDFHVSGNHFVIRRPSKCVLSLIISAGKSSSPYETYSFFSAAGWGNV
jgi:hypothetical protein